MKRRPRYLFIAFAIALVLVIAWMLKEGFTNAISF